MEFVDSHCHLDDKQFDADREDVIRRARESGLKYMLSIGTGDGPPDLEAAIRVADCYPFVYATVGVHPNDAEKSDPGVIGKLRSLLRHPKVKAIGEIGLDYHWGVPKEAQVPVFRNSIGVGCGGSIACCDPHSRRLGRYADGVARSVGAAGFAVRDALLHRHSGPGKGMP